MKRVKVFVMILLALVFAIVGVAEGKAVFRTLSGWDMPPAYNGNPFAPGGVGGAGDYIFGRLFNYRVISRTFDPWLATDYQETPEGLIVHLRKDLKWEDGIPFTSKDVFTTFYIGGAINTWKEVWQYVKEIETPDDYTVVFKWEDNKSILSTIFIMDKKIVAPYHLYASWLEDAINIVKARKEIWKKAAAGEDVSALQEVLSQKVAEFGKSLKAYKPEKPVGIGPFKLQTVTPDEMVLVKREDTPWAEKLMIDEIRAARYTTNELAWAQFMAGQVDLEKPGTPPDVVAALISANPKLRHIPVPDFSTFCLAMNLRKYPFSEKAFRQALAYIIDRDEVREIALHYGATVKYPCGLLPSIFKTWITPEVEKKLNEYSVNHAKAEELLKSLGMYRGNDGLWRTSDGKVLQFEIVARQGYTDWVIAADVISKQLTNFGIQTNVRIVEGAIFGNVLRSGDFDMTIEFGVFEKFHPVQGFDRLYSPSGWIAVITGVDPKGKGPNGEDLDKLVEALYVAEDKSQQKELVQKLALATNEELPVIEFLEKQAQFFVLDGVRVTGWPEYTKSPDDPYVWLPGLEMLDKFGYDWRQASVQWMVEGKLKPVK